MPARTEKKKEKDSENKKEETKNPKKHKEINLLKEPKPYQARHTSSWRSSSTWRFSSVSCYFGSRVPICEDEDAFTLYRRGPCASVTYLKSSQAINNHKNSQKQKESKTPK